MKKTIIQCITVILCVAIASGALSDGIKKVTDARKAIAESKLGIGEETGTDTSMDDFFADFDSDNGTEAPADDSAETPADDKTETPAADDKKTPADDKDKTEDIKEIKFGKYETDTEDEKITEETVWNKKDIEWIVLAKEDGKALIISKYAIDSQPYYKDEDEDEEKETTKKKKVKDVTWETSSLRKWLNKEFIKNAFSAEEQARIIETTVTADKNSEYDTAPGKDTKDKVFILSEAEAKKYFKSDAERLCKPTRYAEASGAWAMDFNNEFKGNCWWGLRTPGKHKDYACCVDFYGKVNTKGDYMDNDSIGVRPAMWIKL